VYETTNYYDIGIAEFIPIKVVKTKETFANSEFVETH